VSESRHAAPPGVLRVLALFHETERLGASTSVLRAVDELAGFGWTTSGWIPGPGSLAQTASDELALVLQRDRPLAFSARGWRESPGLARRALRTPRYLREVREALERVRPHVVHANTLLALPEAAVARSCGLPVVLQAHELPPAGAKTTAAIRYAAGIADVLVAVSDAVAQLLRRHAGRTPVFTVRNGVPAATAQAHTGSSPFTVGTVATVSRTKGTDLFLRAARLSLDERPGLRFEHAGSPDLHRDSGFDAELALLASEIPDPNALTMLGYRPAAEVLPRFDVYVCSSRSEAFPLATLEAMALGIPVVAAAVGGIPEQIDHLETGVLVRPDDAEAIATWLVRLHDDPDLRARVGAAGAERVRSDFTIQAQAEGLHRAYLVALNRRFAPAGVRRAAAGIA